MFGQRHDILGEQDRPRYQNDMRILDPANSPFRKDLAAIKAGLRHMNGLLEVNGADGTLRDPMTLPALRTSVLCLTNLVADLVSHLEREQKKPRTNRGSTE